MDVCLRIKQRLDELGLEQKDLAAAAKVTESYISQLLTRKKLPPDPNRTDIYEKIAKFLKLPNSELLKLVDFQRKEEFKRILSDPPTPLLKELRELVLRKCSSEKRKEVRAIFERQPFGELERLVTSKLLDVVKNLTKEELENEKWLRQVAKFGGRSYEQTRVGILEFLDTDVYHLSPEDCRSFLDPLVKSWQLDLTNFELQIALNQRLAPESFRSFEYVEIESDLSSKEEPGFKEFLADPLHSGDATAEEIAFLRKLRFKGKRPTPLYYYRELQNLRDPLHFRA